MTPTHILYLRAGVHAKACAVLQQVDKINPQVAARMASAFTSWRKFNDERQQQMKQQLEAIVSSEGLSKNVFEIATKALE